MKCRNCGKTCSAEFKLCPHCGDVLEMDKQILMDSLDFGQDSAESEKEFLQRVFLPTSSFQRIKSGRRPLVLGRKGAGKTAICLILYDSLSREGARVSLVTPRDLSKFKMSMLQEASVNASEASLLSWRYTLVTELGLYIIAAAKERLGDNYFGWPDSVKIVRKFLADNVNNQANWIDKTFKIARAVRKLGVKLFEVEVEVGSIPAKAADFSEQLDDVVAHISSALPLVIDGHIHILVDRVDELWEPSVESESLIVGLLRASKEIRDQIDLANVVVFLRSDIYDSLKFHDSDKFHSAEERIIWDKDNLKRLVALRARASTNLRGRRDAYDEIWASFFPPTIGSKDSFEYLLDYTLMRPRDLIQLCNSCRDDAQHRGHGKIEIEDVLDALPQYSKWKLKDLRDEYQVQYPFLEKVFLGMFQHSAPRLSREDISERFELIRDNLIPQFGSSYFEPFDNLLQILYNIGFLGAAKGDKVLYNCMGDNVVISYISNFQIHPAFRLALEVESEAAVYVFRADACIVGAVGDGAIAQGSGAVVSGASGVAIGGDVHGDVITGRRRYGEKDEAAPEE